MRQGSAASAILRAMARLRNPTAELERSGGFEVHPEQRRACKDEPVPAGPLGNHPEHLTDGQKAVWRELVGQVPDGVVTIADRFLVPAEGQRQGSRR